MALHRRLLLGLPLLALAPPAAVAQATAPAPPAPSLLERVQALGLDQRAAGRVTAWYPAGLRERAESLRALIDDAAGYFHQQLGIDAELHLAVLTREQWGRVISGQPYGIPGVAGRPPVVFMPAGDDGLAAEDALALRPHVAAATLKALADAGFDYETASRRYVDLVGLHELGHAYAQRFALWANCRWLDELVATFFAYAYLRERHPRLAALWDGVLQAYVDAVEPAHRTLADFDRLYFGVGARNYVWYQAQFQRMVRQAYEARGVAFLRDLQAHFNTPSPVALAPERILARLDPVMPGFRMWAASMAGAGGGAPGR
ncbi:MAG: hypothetical protein KF683_24955 [Rubrivivax sp.]|nr:hypothetical protein [Rubrivivax sp.]